MNPVLMDENFLDAYEFIECPIPEIQSMINELPINLGNRSRPGMPQTQVVQEYAVAKIGKFLEKLPVQKLSVDDILKLNNLDIMPEDPYTLKAISEVRGQEGYREVFLTEMLKRDKRDYREREFPLDLIIEAVEQGSCRPLLIVELNNIKYVIDGRTRLYASIAANKDANVIVINDKNLKEYLGGI